MTWNIRSLLSAHNQHALALSLNSLLPEVCVITETWMKSTLPIIHQDYSQLQFPLNSHQGVAIFANRRYELTPILKTQWENHFVIAKINKRKEDIAIVTIYV